nr:glycosyltransferase [Candidatus Krumholzibacteria bacterium]
MKIWIANINEPLPTDPGQPRLWRMGQVFQLLRARGHDVTWWSSTMHHFEKKLRFEESTLVEMDAHSRVCHLHGRFYGKNISLARFRNHREIGREFRRLSAHQPVPDVILASIPILDLPREAAVYASGHGIPLVIDIRDKWPDFMVDQAPALARPLARQVLRPLFRDARTACRAARAVWGVTPGFVRWGLAHAGRAVGPWDLDFPHAYPDSPLPDDLLHQAGQFWDDLGVRADDPLPTICFIGSFNFTAFDFSTLVEGMRQLEGQARLVFCGSGVGEQQLRGLAEGAANILFSGWVDEPALRVIMQRSVMGVTPYRNNANFTENLPNKFLEYLSQGLPVVSCLGGYSRQVLEPAGVGLFYEEGDAGGFVRSVQTLLTREELRAQMSRQAHELFAARFRATTVYGAMIDTLEDLAAADL